MQDDFYIRPGLKSDRQQILSFLDSLPAEDRKFLALDKKRNAIKQSISGKGRHVFLSTKDDQVVGYLRKSDRPNKTMLVEEIAVHPDYRRHGLGSKLLTHVESGKPARLEAKSLVKNQRIANLFKKHGYEPQLSPKQEIVYWGKDVGSMQKQASSMYKVQQSARHGQGTFAALDLTPGVNMGVAMFSRKKSRDASPDQRFIRLHLGRYTNHSPKPNMDIKKSVDSKGRDLYFFVTKKDVKKGEELTVNYNNFDFDGKRDFVKKASVNRLELQQKLEMDHPYTAGFAAGVPLAVKPGLAFDRDIRNTFNRAKSEAGKEVAKDAIRKYMDAIVPFTNDVSFGDDIIDHALKENGTSVDEVAREMGITKRQAYDSLKIGMMKGLPDIPEFSRARKFDSERFFKDKEKMYEAVEDLLGNKSRLKQLNRAKNIARYGSAASMLMLPMMTGSALSSLNKYNKKSIAALREGAGINTDNNDRLGELEQVHRNSDELKKGLALRKAMYALAGGIGGHYLFNRSIGATLKKHPEVIKIFSRKKPVNKAQRMLFESVPALAGGVAGVELADTDKSPEIAARIKSEFSKKASWSAEDEYKYWKGTDKHLAAQSAAIAAGNAATLGLGALAAGAMFPGEGSRLKGAKSTGKQAVDLIKKRIKNGFLGRVVAPALLASYVAAKIEQSNRTKEYFERKYYDDIKRAIETGVVSMRLGKELNMSKEDFDRFERNELKKAIASRAGLGIVGGGSAGYVAKDVLPDLLNKARSSHLFSSIISNVEGFIPVTPIMDRMVGSNKSLKMGPAIALGSALGGAAMLNPASLLAAKHAIEKRRAIREEGVDRAKKKYGLKQ